MAGSPRIIARPTTRSPAACRRARVRQGQAFGGAEEAPSLTAAAPRRRWKYAVGTEECSRRGSNKRMECKGRPKWRDAPLTKKAPYKPYAGKPPVRFGGRGGQKPSLPLSTKQRARRHASSFSRHGLPEFCIDVAPRKREQGTPGARCTRGLVCKNARKKAHTSIQVQRRQ